MNSRINLTRRRMMMQPLSKGKLLKDWLPGVRGVGYYCTVINDHCLVPSGALDIFYGDKNLFDWGYDINQYCDYVIGSRYNPEQIYFTKVELECITPVNVDYGFKFRFKRPNSSFITTTLVANTIQTYTIFDSVEGILAYGIQFLVDPPKYSSNIDYRLKLYGYNSNI